VRTHATFCPRIDPDDNQLTFSIYLSESGWTDTYNCVQWIQKVFFPVAKACRIDETKPILLVMDGHNTHESADIQRAIYEILDKENIEIIILCLPSKTTHMLQPLDVLIFGQVDRKWNKVCEESLRDGIRIDRQTVIPVYVKGTREAFTEELIAKAFRKSGLYPVNPDVFGPDDFAPAQASSISPHVPDSCPIDFPSSDPVEPTDSEWYPESDAESEASKSTIIWAEDEEQELSEPEVFDPPARQCDEIDPDNLACNPSQPIPKLMAALAKLETEVIHMTRSTTASLELSEIKPLKFVSPHEDCKLSVDGLLSELQSVRKQLFFTHQALGHALGQLSAANAHCTLLHHELGNVKVKLENMTKRMERRSTKTGSRFITSKDMHETFIKEEEERKERERIASEKQKIKQAKNIQHEHQVMQDSLHRSFTGRLSSYKKNDLRALAISLSIDDKGTNSDLLSRINAHFNQHPDLRGNPRYSSLSIGSTASGASVSQTNPTAIPPDHHPQLPNAIASSSSYHIEPPNAYHTFQTAGFGNYSNNLLPNGSNLGSNASPYYYTNF
jgi:DDE superfamily endonuclease